MTEPVAELSGVVKTYPDTPERRILDGLDLRIDPGQRLAIVGPSGSGKSTLLNILGTLDRPDSGQVRIAGQDTSGLTETGLGDLRGKHIGFIFQLHHLLPQCTVLENVLVPTLSRQEAETGELHKRAANLLERVGLKAHVHKRPGQLSGGERQRVAVVRSLINDPRLLLADEPTGSLDHQNAEKLTSLLLEISREREVALVFVTHDRDLAGRMDSVLVLSDGKLV